MKYVEPSFELDIIAKNYQKLFPLETIAKVTLRKMAAMDLSLFDTPDKFATLSLMHWQIASVDYTADFIIVYGFSFV